MFVSHVYILHIEKHTGWYVERRRKTKKNGIKQDSLLN